MSKFIIILLAFFITLIPVTKDRGEHNSTINQLVGAHPISKPFRADLKAVQFEEQKSTSEPHKTVRKPQDKPSGGIEQIVRNAANKYGIDEEYFVKIAKCESTLNPNSVNYNYYENGHPSGLFQHISGYWPGRATKYGWKGASVFNAQANAEVTAQMFRDGHQNLWECK